MMNIPLISVCVPSYNRAEFLRPLIDSVLAQDEQNFEIVICEDASPQRQRIAEIIHKHYSHDKRIVLHLNEKNLGYDANFRELLMRASGEYCFFMGNDDIMAPGALSKVAQVVTKHDDIGVILRSYSWFITDPARPEQTIRYFDSDRVFPPGAATIATAYRRCGVLSGFVVHRETANAYATSRFDGYLYYQMYLAACVLTEKRCYYIHDVITYSRSTEAPDFGNSATEEKIFVPGRYTPEARTHMVTGMLNIARAVEQESSEKFYDMVERDIANYIYPYISDQLNLPLSRYLRLHRAMSDLGLARHHMFHLHFLAAYILKERGYHTLTKFIRSKMGRSPVIGGLYAGEAVQ